MTKDEIDFIISTIAGSPKEVSTDSFIELNKLLHDTLYPKICSNCELHPQENEPYPEVCGCCSRFYADGFEEKKDD